MLLRLSLKPRHTLTTTILAVGFFFVPLVWALPLIAHAQFDKGFLEVEAERVKQDISDFNGSLGGFIIALLKILGALVAVLALAALLWGALMYITSLGDEGKAETAKKIIMYALIGLLILGAAGIVVNVAINLIMGN